MKDINNFIDEKLRIDKNIKDEEFYENGTELWSEVQNEIETNAGYKTYNFSAGKKKYKKGFIFFAGDDEFISVEGYNTVDDLEDLFNCNPGYYKDMDNLEIGECSEDPDGKIMRIW